MGARAPDDERPRPSLRFLDRLVGVPSVATERPLAGSCLSLLEAYPDHAALAMGQADLRRQLEARRETRARGRRAPEQGLPARKRRGDAPGMRD